MFCQVLSIAGVAEAPDLPVGSTHMPSIGPLELIIVLVIVLLIFGPKRLPEMGRQLGKGMREFKDSVTGDSKDDDDVSLPPAEPAVPAAPAASESRERDTVS